VSIWQWTGVDRSANGKLYLRRGQQVITKPCCKYECVPKLGQHQREQFILQVQANPGRSAMYRARIITCIQYLNANCAVLCPRKPLAQTRRTLALDQHAPWYSLTRLRFSAGKDMSH
jgi:hypothetical protein